MKNISLMLLICAVLAVAACSSNKSDIFSKIELQKDGAEYQFKLRNDVAKLAIDIYPENAKCDIEHIYLSGGDFKIETTRNDLCTTRIFQGEKLIGTCRIINSASSYSLTMAAYRRGGALNSGEPFSGDTIPIFCKSP